MKPSHHSSSRQGFSLIEMLVVIAVIGIVAAIAIPTIGNVREKAKTAAAKRNAQSISTVSSAANAAGAYHVIPDFVPDGGIQGSIDLLSLGVTSELGFDFDFSISESAALDAEEFLEIRESAGEFLLVYTGD